MHSSYLSCRTTIKWGWLYLSHAPDHMHASIRYISTTRTTSHVC
uniref:Uncharacterized protein n=1 Tax=Arundo donax TaxID=35708 RepID=A0A0A9B032_ARUDO